MPVSCLAKERAQAGLVQAYLSGNVPYDSVTCSGLSKIAVATSVLSRSIVGQARSDQ